MNFYLNYMTIYGHSDDILPLIVYIGGSKLILGMKEAELNAALTNELEIYRRLLDNIPAELGIFDPQGKFIYNTPSGIKDPVV